MATTVQCNIVSADESLFSGAVEMVVATGSLGELGINAGHAPLLSDLKPGPVRVIKAAGEEEKEGRGGLRLPVRWLLSGVATRFCVHWSARAPHASCHVTGVMFLFSAFSQLLPWIASEHPHPHSAQAAHACTASSSCSACTTTLCPTS